MNGTCHVIVVKATDGDTPQWKINKKKEVAKTPGRSLQRSQKTSRNLQARLEIFLGKQNNGFVESPVQDSRSVPDSSELYSALR